MCRLLRWPSPQQTLQQQRLLPWQLVLCDDSIIVAMLPVECRHKIDGVHEDEDDCENNALSTEAASK